MAMHSEMWFPSVVWSSIIHVVDNSKLKNFAYQRKKIDNGRTISNYGGFQSTDIKLGECEEIDYLVEYINKEVDNCSRQVGLDTPKIANIWLNINPPGCYNSLHNHQDAIFSGVYYVDANNMQGNLEFERNDGAEYFLPTKPLKYTYFTATKTVYAAKTNALYIFPSWMKHSVQGNQTKSDRISISFNYSF